LRSATDAGILDVLLSISYGDDNAIAVAISQR